MLIGFMACEGQACGLAYGALRSEHTACVSAYLIIAAEKLTFHFPFPQALRDVYAKYLAFLATKSIIIIVRIPN